MAEIVTGEAVVLEVPCARFPSRMLAFAIDLAIQLTLLFLLFALVGLGARKFGLGAAAGAAIGITILVLVLIGYPIIWETATRGRSPGKFALGLRVVGDDGSPVRFRQALVRGLATVVDFWLLPFFGVPALISSLLSDKGKRLGDIFAGTFVIQQRLPARRGAAARPPAMPPELAAWATSLELSGLTDQTAATARRYLARLPELTPTARAELGERISAAVRAQVGPPPPPGTPAASYLGAVLAERHRREHARLLTTAGTAPAWAPLPALGPPPGAASPGAAPPSPGAPPPSRWAAPGPAPTGPWPTPTATGHTAAAAGTAPAASWPTPAPPGTTPAAARTTPAAARTTPAAARTTPTAAGAAPAAAGTTPTPPGTTPAAAGVSTVPTTEWLGAGWEGEEPPHGHSGEPTSPPAAGTGFAPPQ